MLDSIIKGLLKENIFSGIAHLKVKIAIEVVILMFVELIIIDKNDKSQYDLYNQNNYLFFFKIWILALGGRIFLLIL